MEYKEEMWHGERAWYLTGGGYEAVVLPTFGANCISLRHSASGANLLRTPPSAEELRANPNVYGLPLLFPPNRIADGRYMFQGRLYELPINEPYENHHMHGLLSVAPFAPMGDGAFIYRADEGAPYLTFPHAFTVTRRYRLSERGLEHIIAVTNDGDADMPLGVGVHAAWRVPFFDNDDTAGYTLRIPVKRQWLVSSDRHIPTSEFIEQSPLIDALRRGEAVPEQQALSCLFERGEGDVTLRCASGVMSCTLGQSLPFVMLWNGGGGQGFVCPEPQSIITNAPNLPLPPSVTRLIALKPGQSADFTMTLSFTAA